MSHDVAKDRGEASMLAMIDQQASRTNGGAS